MGLKSTLQKYFKGDPILWAVIAVLAGNLVVGCL